MFKAMEHIKICNNFTISLKIKTKKKSNERKVICRSFTVILNNV